MARLTCLVILGLALLVACATAIRLPNGFAPALYGQCKQNLDGTYTGTIITIHPTHRNDTFKFEEASRGFYHGCNDTFFFIAEKSVYQVRFLSDLGFNQSLIQYFGKTVDNLYTFDGYGHTLAQGACTSGQGCCTVPKIDGQPISLLSCVAKQCSGSGVGYDAFQTNTDGSWQWGAAAAQCTNATVKANFDTPFTRIGPLHSYDSSSEAANVMPSVIAVVISMLSVLVALL